MRRYRTLLVAAVLTVALAGCTQSTPAAPSTGGSLDTTTSSSPVDTTSTAPTTAVPTRSSATPAAPVSSSTSPAPTRTPTSPPRTSTTAAPPTPVASSTAPPDGPDGCPSSALSVRALRASGAAGHQYAFLQFTNTSATSCSLTGYPGVQLLAAGKPLGKPAVRSGVAIKKLVIAAGGSVTARLTDASTCNAVNSDSVQIYPPNRTMRLVLALKLRACSLTIDPVVPS